MRIRHAIAGLAITAGLLAGAATHASADPATPPATVSTAQALHEIFALEHVGGDQRPFWQYLNELQNMQGEEGIVIAGPNPPTEHIIYGGTPLGAFLYALQLGPTVQFDITAGPQNPDA